jgi:hypothetical protein
MQSAIPSTDEIRRRLQVVKLAELGELALKSGVPFGTLMKIRTGQTLNPGIETVRKFIGLIEPAQRDAATLNDQQPARQEA